MRSASSRPVPPSIEGLDWLDTERLTARLAAVLRRELGADLPSFTFLPIPRGGTLVLGMLAYLLPLEKEQLAPPEGGRSERLVLVDDCALSGARIARALERTTAPRVVVAHLLSHPELRRAVERDEPRVERCLAAGDLVDRQDLPAAALEGFAERWRSRLPGRRYWLGPLAAVAFPWSEPETVWWNAREGRLEDGWHRVAPWRCLRFRAELELPDAEGARGPIDLAPGTLWKLDDDRLLVRGGPEDRLHGFREVALDVWRGLLAFGDRERTVSHLEARYDVDPEELRRDVDELVDDLRARGLLVDTSEA